MNLKNITAEKLVALYRNKDLSVTEVIKSVYEEIDRVDGDVQAFLALCPERALDEARRLDSKIASGESLEPLAGVPVAIKDNMVVRDLATTCASRCLKDTFRRTRPQLSSECAVLVRSSLARRIATNSAMGSTTENSGYQVTRNPHNLDRVPGGSSGGSAASVASGTSVIALGSDTGGSVRTPAAFCGVVGVKPTYGRVSRYGLVAFGSSLDQIGPLSKTVREAAQTLEIICGFDHFDSTSSDTAVDEFSKTLDQPIKGTKIGIPKEYFLPGLDSEVRAKIEAGIRVYEDLGCEMQEISLPHTEYAVATYYLVATAEASSNLARYDGVRYGPRQGGGTLQEMYRRTRHNGFGKEVKRRILLGTYALSAGYYDAYYLKALKVRTLMLKDFQKAFEQCRHYSDADIAHRRV